MNHIDFIIAKRKATPSGKYQKWIDVVIDGEPLSEKVERFEMAMAWSQNLTRTYGPIDHVDGIRAYYLGYGKYLWGDNEDKQSVLDCCKCSESFGCWPLLCHIIQRDDTIIWANFENEHREELTLLEQKVSEQENRVISFIVEKLAGMG